jgi:hypothetical protein
MAIELATATRTAVCDAQLGLANAGAGPAVIRIATTAFASILASITCADPAYSGASSGVAALAGTPLQDTSADNTGTAAVWDLRDSDSNLVMDGPVATSGGGDINLAAATQNAGLQAIRTLMAGASDVQFTTAGDTGFASVLATIALNSGAFEAPSAGAMALDVSPAVNGTGSAGGTMGLFRFRTSGGAEVLRGTVGTTGADWNFATGIVVGNGATIGPLTYSLTLPSTIASSDGALVIANTSIEAGEIVEITSGEFNQPAS